MSNFAIVTDSACDLCKEFRQEHGIDYARMMLSWTTKDGQTKEISASLDWEEVSSKEFYDIIRSGIRIYTAQITKQNYLDTFEPHLQKGEDVLYIACSSGLSASLKTAQLLAQEELKEKYPNNKVVVLDSLRAGMAEGLIVMDAVKLKEEGKSLEEVIDFVEKEKLRYQEIGIPETLSYLKRAGRVTAPQAFFGNMIQLKPILQFDDEGKNNTELRVFGRNKAYEKMAEIIASRIDDPENQEIYLMNADCTEKDIELFKKYILKAVKVKDIIALPLGPIIGASSGPGTIIVNYKIK